MDIGLTQQRVKEMLNYDADTGSFTWKVSASRNIKIGSSAGCLSHGKRVVIRVDGTLYQAHRLVWLYETGKWPIDQIDHIDHIDGNPNNNRLSNLRECTNAENMQNMEKFSNNKSGHIGVCWEKCTNKFVARIRSYGKTKTIGRFETALEASKAYQKAKRELHLFQPEVRNSSIAA